MSWDIYATSQWKWQWQWILEWYQPILTRGDSWSTTSICCGRGPDFLPSRNCEPVRLRTRSVLLPTRIRNGEQTRQTWVCKFRSLLMFYPMDLIWHLQTGGKETTSSVTRYIPRHLCYITMEIAMITTMNIGIGLSGYQCILTRGNSWSTTSCVMVVGQMFCQVRIANRVIGVCDQLCCRPVSWIANQPNKLGFVNLEVCYFFTRWIWYATNEPVAKRVLPQSQGISRDINATSLCKWQWKWLWILE
jgi:hypothetical protein